MAYSISPVQAGESRELCLASILQYTDGICRSELLRKSSDPPPKDALAMLLTASAAARAQTTQSTPLAQAFNQLVISTQAIVTQSMLQIISQAPPSGVIKMHGKYFICNINRQDEMMVMDWIRSGRLYQAIIDIKAYALRYSIPMVALVTDMPFTGPSVYIQSMDYDSSKATIDPELDEFITLPQKVTSAEYRQLPAHATSFYSAVVDWSTYDVEYFKVPHVYGYHKYDNNYVVESLIARKSWYAMSTVATQLTSAASAKSAVLPVIERVPQFNFVTTLSILYTTVTYLILESQADYNAFIFEAYNVLIVPKYLSAQESDDLQDPTNRARVVNPSLPQNIQSITTQQRMYQPTEQDPQVDVTNYEQYGVPEQQFNTRRTQRPAPSRIQPKTETQQFGKPPRQNRGRRATGRGTLSYSERSTLFNAIRALLDLN